MRVYYARLTGANLIPYFKYPNISQGKLQFLILFNRLSPKGLK